MPIQIVYLGWGSLLWRDKNLKIDSWSQTDIEVPLEFSRISKDGRLTLVIDEANGVKNKLWMAQTKYTNIDRAINALKLRENTLKSGISYINLPKKKYRIVNTPPKITQEIVLWALKEGIDVVIWTDLPSNWTSIRGSKYSPHDALQYFKTVPWNIQLKIFDYVYGAVQMGHIKTHFSPKFLTYFGDHIKHLGST